MKNSQRSQELVKLSTEKEGEEFISFLEHKGLLNVNHINFDSLIIKVLVVDKNKFYPANVTALAALTNCGIKPITTDEFKEKYEL